MSELIVAFALGASFSFLGSIPPGTLNMWVLKLGLEGRTRVALRFAAAVAVIEYPYAWMAVKFESWVTSHPMVLQHFKIITALVLTLAGMLILFKKNQKGSSVNRSDQSGFRRGLILGILNPMAIPFWMAVTAYLRSNGWLDISTGPRLHSYVLGTSVGTILLFGLLIFLARRVSGYAQQHALVHRAPGIILVTLGLYAFFKYINA